MTLYQKISSYIKRFLSQFEQQDFLYTSLIGITAVFPVIISSVILFQIKEFDYLLSHGGIGIWIAFFGASIFTMALAITPTTFISILSGYFFGLMGLWGVIIAYPIAAFLGLGLGKNLYRLFGHSNFFQQPKYQHFLKKLSEDQFRMLIFARLSPVLPFAMTNVILGQLPINLWKYLAGTMIGMLPRTLLSFFAGMKAKEIWNLIQNPETSSSSQLITAILILVSTLGLFWVFRNALKKMGDK